MIKGLIILLIVINVGLATLCYDCNQKRGFTKFNEIENFGGKCIITDTDTNTISCSDGCATEIYIGSLNETKFEVVWRGCENDNLKDECIKEVSTKSGQEGFVEVCGFRCSGDKCNSAYSPNVFTIFFPIAITFLQPFY